MVRVVYCPDDPVLERPLFRPGAEFDNIDFFGGLFDAIWPTDMVVRLCSDPRGHRWDDWGECQVIAIGRRQALRECGQGRCIMGTRKGLPVVYDVSPA